MYFLRYLTGSIFLLHPIYINIHTYLYTQPSFCLVNVTKIKRAARNQSVSFVIEGRCLPRVIDMHVISLAVLVQQFSLRIYALIAGNLFFISSILRKLVI